MIKFRRKKELEEDKKLIEETEEEKETRKYNEASTTERIGRFIRVLRENHNLTQDELGKQLFITRKAVSKWETGQATPSVDMMHTLASKFGVNFVEIAEGRFITSKDITFKGLLKRGLKYLIIGLIISSLLILIGYFIKNHNSNNIYEINYMDESFMILNSSVMITPDRYSFRMGSFVSYISDKNEDNDYIFNLYYLDENNDKASIASFSGNNFAFSKEASKSEIPLSVIQKNIEDLYLEVSYVNLDDETVEYNLPLEVTLNETVETEMELLNWYDRDDILTRDTRSGLVVPGTEMQVDVKYNQATEENSKSAIEIVSDDVKTIDLSFLYEMSSKELKEKYDGKSIEVDGEKFEVSYYGYRKIFVENQKIKCILDINSDKISIIAYETKIYKNNYNINIFNSTISIGNLENKIQKFLINVIISLSK